MQRLHILLLILLAAATIAGGCTETESTEADIQSLSPTPLPVPTEVEAAVAGHPAPTPPVPSRDKGPLRVEFLDPWIYHTPTPTPTIATTKQPDDIRISEGMTEYTVVAASDLSFTPRDFITEAYHIPFPYWAVNVSAVPIDDFPLITVQIQDPEDPNHIIESIRYTRNEFPFLNSTTSREFIEKDQRFFIKEGYKDYRFVIHTEAVRSFKITVYVPTKYLV